VSPEPVEGKMRVGLDGKYQPGFPTLRQVHESGLDGAFFRSPVNFSPTLDPGALREARAFADDHDLYLELGVGRINPFTFDKNPELFALGGGDYRVGFERVVRACQLIGCVEIWCVTGTYVDRYSGKAPWADQLRATLKFLQSLAPMLRDVGCRLNMETHEEVTTFELLRLIEAIGPDVLGLCLDTGNLVARAQDPIDAAHRVAPYVHLSHIKDVILYFIDDGLERQVRACGEGIIDWDELLPIVGKSNPRLNLSIEDHKGLMGVQIFDPAWRAGLPDLTADELAKVVQLAWICEKRISSGALMAPATYEAIPFSEQRDDRLKASVAYLRDVIRRHNLA
jgi:sugar phosphate isomerase/epimerase